MAFLAAAPEVEEAGAAVAARRGGSRAATAAKGKGRKITPDMSKAEVEAELQDRAKRAQARKDIANNPKVEPDDDPKAPTAKATAAPLVQVGRMDPVHTGSGFVLGLVGWVLFMNYMQGGMPQVRRWGAAKFLNRTTGSTTGGK